MVALLGSIAKLIEELKDLVSAILAHINVEPDEGCLDEGHDFFEHFSVLLNHILQGFEGCARQPLA